MGKKIVAIAVALVLCLSCVSALASASKTTQDVVSTVTSDTSASIIVAQPTAETKAILEEVAALANSNTSVAEYFGIQDVEAAEDLKVDELFPVILTGTTEGPATVTLSTAASYTEDDNLSSQHLCQKLGMRREGLFLEFISFVNNPDGTPRYENTVQYAILKKEWDRQPSD